MDFWLENWAMTQLREYAKTDPAFAREIVDTLNDPAFAEHATKDLVARFHAAVSLVELRRARASASELIKIAKTDRQFARAVVNTILKDKAFARAHPSWGDTLRHLRAAVSWTRGRQHRAKDAGVDAAISGAMAKAGW